MILSDLNEGYGDNRLTWKMKLESFHNQLMSTTNQLHSVDIIELYYHQVLVYVCYEIKDNQHTYFSRGLGSEEPASPAGTLCPV